MGHWLARAGQWRKEQRGVGRISSARFGRILSITMKIMTQPGRGELVERLVLKGVRRQSEDEMGDQGNLWGTVAHGVFELLRGI